MLLEVGDLPPPTSPDLFVFFSWYTYDPNGNPVYLVGGGNRAIGEAMSTDLTFPVVDKLSAVQPILRMPTARGEGRSRCERVGKSKNWRAANGS